MWRRDGEVEAVAASAAAVVVLLVIVVAAGWDTHGYNGGSGMGYVW